MKTQCILLALTAWVLSGMPSSHAGTPVSTITQFVILVHPCPYEAMGKADTDPYRSLERAACQRWFDAIGGLPLSSFVVQVDFPSAGSSPDRLHRAFIDRLGAGRVCRIPSRTVSPEEPAVLQDYYQAIHRQIAQQIAAQVLTFDSATCKALIWGQSFEGCAAGFGSAIASGLGLKMPTQLPYEMSAPDAPFLLNATWVRSIPIPKSDVQAYVFDLKDGRCAAFFRSCLTPQWLDRRPIALALDCTLFQVFTKQGDLVWPDGVTPTAEQQQHTRYNQWRTIGWPPDTPLPTPASFLLATIQERFVIAKTPHLPQLIAVIASAQVGAQGR